jgi:hypothetical protein
MAINVHGTVHIHDTYKIRVHCKFFISQGSELFNFWLVRAVQSLHYHGHHAMTRRYYKIRNGGAYSLPHGFVSMAWLLPPPPHPPNHPINQFERPLVQLHSTEEGNIT